MSVYSLLSMPVPTIAYTILHESRPGLPHGEYTATIRALHARIAEESASLVTALRNETREAVTRQAQALRGQLAQFLSTPIKTDVAEVQKIIAESLEKFCNQFQSPGPPGVTSSTEGRIIFPAPKKPLERKLLQNGREMLRSLGFSAEKSTEVHESVFVIQGGMNFDVLEYLVRDRLGIYGPNHGNHLNETGAFTFAGYNLVLTKPGPSPGGLGGKAEIAFHFSKPDVQYGPFREALGFVTDELLKSGATSSCSLWQRKLGFGKTREFILRCVVPSADRCEDLARIIRGTKEFADLSQAVTVEGCAMIKEFIV